MIKNIFNKKNDDENIDIVKHDNVATLESPRYFEYEVTPECFIPSDYNFHGHVYLSVDIKEDGEPFINKTLFRYIVRYGKIIDLDNFNKDIKKYLKMKPKDWDELCMELIKEKIKKEDSIELGNKNIKEMMNKLHVSGSVTIK